ncbi:MAG: hypothetical protein A2V21_311585 [Deltaproteobacteria bacterium GWC2_55_46]|nr:MAG: hypothetical protein A2Z79_11345 [Deltaproteobacteria bacterium GWA2_55_82]OGQ63467.1 MAG: hypothetical protein A3I81_05530 [Deltaproteobacteria bacterium RIFCSPLOWO2_02_FULL_55_12]OIJ74848.1 MAG: hypothetical protein A2V21_311585 [Deltaproteobacteria bacterium GWC2_55_46]
MKDIFLEAAGIYLRPPREEDLEGDWYGWLNDMAVTRFQNKGIFPNTREKQREYYNFVMGSKNDVVFAIVEKEGDRHIGSVGLHKIDWVHRSAELGIVIGERGSWGKGYGKAAWGLITGYGFNVLNLHRIYAIVMEGNLGSVRCAEENGFRKEGEIRDFFYKNGAYHRVLYFNAIREDFERKDGRRP